MRRKRGIIHLVILVVAVAMIAVMFAMPLMDAGQLAQSTESTYMQVCSALAKNLSRQKNTGMAMTLFGMVVGFGGVVITVLLTPFVRKSRRARDATGTISALATLIPVILLAVKSPALLEILGVSGVVSEQSILSLGAYVLSALAVLMTLLSASGLLVGLHLKSAAKKPASKPEHGKAGKSSAMDGDADVEASFEVWDDMPQQKKDLAKDSARKKAEEKEGPKEQEPEEHKKPPAKGPKGKKEPNIAPQEIDGGQGADQEIPALEDSGAIDRPEANDIPKDIQHDDDITILRTMATGPVGGVMEGLTGAYAGARIELGVKEEVLVGRNPKFAHVVIDKNNADISRKHCGIRIEEQSGKYLVTDYSRNGTFAKTEGSEEEMRLPPKKAIRLPEGTVIRLGRRGNTFLLK